MRFRLAWVLFLFVSSTWAASPHREVVSFSYTSDVGFGNSVFVVGNHPDLGSWDITRAIKLRHTPGNVWTGQIAVQAGTQLQYSYVRRSTAQGSWCSATNGTYLTGVLTHAVPAQPPAPYVGKTIYYLSSWSSANLFYRNGANFVTAAMTRIGSGRVAGESLFKINGIGEAGEALEFVFNDGMGNFDNPPGGGNYFTGLDVFQVQDDNVFSYQPPPTLSAPRITIQFVNSTAPNIAGRNVRIYLPRGYDQNTARRYPVVYFHDGQNIFDPTTAFGGVEWQADETATREIGQGRMREAILVGVDNTSARIPEYMPPNDSYQGTPGRGDAYASFLINNVRPFLDTNFRTLNDPKNTMTLGSSLGGLISLYLGREFSTFGKIGVVSPAFWVSPNYVAQAKSGLKKPLRVHLDMGTTEGQNHFDNCLSMYDAHLAQTYAANNDVTFVAGCGHGHNEAAWRQRLPGIFTYLVPAREDPAELAQREYPPKFVVTDVNVPDGNAIFTYTGLFGISYGLERSVNMTSWAPISTTPPESAPWSIRTLSDNSLGENLPKAFWRLNPVPSP